MVLTNNNTETKWGQKLLRLSNAVCFPSGRIKFWTKEGQEKRGSLQGQMILGFWVETKRFTNNFKGLGLCRVRSDPSFRLRLAK